ncbi:hypothetical protein MmiHf6_09750 [Methanimicrococcus hongohii]|uniref:Uncharacterized protein n=1 Tax=Methanimicrococcus hongohii TaxID=3028295 RepID=A0AA96UZN5_9EURY|nr:hypothetical protein [Methanimicrococcus sp. Hf6]WNY23664.1 hypothetical protein MmiHf6_09750 [Methanimicrococcus sp. Hf6]
MTHHSYIKFNDGSKFDVENFKLLSMKENDEQFFDENGRVFSLHVPDQLKVKFEIDLKDQNYIQALSMIGAGSGFTTVNYEDDDEKDGTGYNNCHVFLINEDTESKKAYVVCNWTYTEVNLLS